MFGKKSKQTSLEKFITQKGMDVGNLKRAQGKVASAPMHKGSPKTLDDRYTKARPVSPGKAGPVKITG